MGEAAADHVGPSAAVLVERSASVVVNGTGSGRAENLDSEGRSTQGEVAHTACPGTRGQEGENYQDLEGDQNLERTAEEDSSC